MFGANSPEKVAKDGESRLQDDDVGPVCIVIKFDPFPTMAAEAVPKIVGRVQRLVATVLQEQRNHPAVSAKAVKAALKSLQQPLPGAYLNDLREGHHLPSAMVRFSHRKDVYRYFPEE